MPRAIAIVVDLGFGDAGKGTVTDHLVRRLDARTVVRFNGGAQAGHNVVTSDGRHHTFAQLGSGTFVPGVTTHLSRFVVVHPTALIVEAKWLAAVGVGDALDRVTIADRALVTTPVHQAAARIRQLAREAARFGSCGVGVGETMRDAIASPHDAVRARDLADVVSLRRAVVRHQARKRDELGSEIRALAGVVDAEPEIRALEDPRAIDAWIDALAPLRDCGIVVGDEHLASVLRGRDAVVFEGAQGVLLDEWRGFHPYTTWSTCTFDNALALVRELGDDRPIARVGVLRTYATRHGAGPFPTETSELAHLDEPHNVNGPWQGAFRRGWLDAVLAKYAMAACNGVDGIALTHVDALARMPRWRVCRDYRGAVPIRLGEIGDLEHTAALARMLAHVEPIYDDVALAGDAAARVIAKVEDMLGARVVLTSSGPTAADKTDRS